MILVVDKDGIEQLINPDFIVAVWPTSLPEDEREYVIVRTSTQLNFTLGMTLRQVYDLIHPPAQIGRDLMEDAQ